MGLQSRVTPHARQLRECALLGLSIGWAGGYAAALGEGGADAVAAWVWQQALEDWPRG